MDGIKKAIDQDLMTVRFTLAAGRSKSIPVTGQWFEVLYNSISTNPQVSVNAGPLYEIPAGLAKRVKPFERIEFYNPSAASMELWVLVSDYDTYDNRMILAALAAGLYLPIIDVSTEIETPASITVLPRTGFLIDVGPAVNVGGGVVGIPVTGHPFTAGQAITISGCPQYNGANTVVAGGGANQVNVTATYKGGLLDNAAAVDVGGGVVGIPITGHSYTVGETIRLAGTVNYDGDEVVVAGGGANQVNITAAYVAKVFTGAETHNLVFDGVDDRIALTTAQSIPASATRKELHIVNHDDTYRVFFGDANVQPTSYRGVIIQPDSVYILTCQDEIFLACEDGAGVTGCVVSWGNFTYTP